MFVSFYCNTRRVPIVDQKRLPLREHMSSPSVFGVVRVAQSSLYCFVYQCLSCCPLFVCYCIVCPLIYGSHYHFGIFDPCTELQERLVLFN